MTAAEIALNLKAKRDAEEAERKAIQASWQKHHDNHKAALTDAATAAFLSFEPLGFNYIPAHQKLWKGNKCVAHFKVEWEETEIGSDEKPVLSGGWRITITFADTSSHNIGRVSDVERAIGTSMARYL